ncbi:hypothetical protein JW796_00600 [Candidatus Dojkabacteria bacterium]|nr:hypothetical protein [Candidatus Dojkabacteria bacterium]
MSEDLRKPGILEDLRRPSPCEFGQKFQLFIVTEGEVPVTISIVNIPTGRDEEMLVKKRFSVRPREFDSEKIIEFCEVAVYYWLLDEAREFLRTNGYEIPEGFDDDNPDRPPDLPRQQSFENKVA